ncbi:hypothetical protein JCM11641_004214 [Rhodosporidiobolus odoratus]
MTSSALVQESGVVLETGPLLRLLPPQPITRPLPPLPPSSPIHPGWTSQTYILPAAFPRSYKGSTRPASSPRSPFPTPPKPGQRINPNEAYQALLGPQVEGFSYKVKLGDQTELDGQEQLAVVVNRYRPEKKVEGKGLTLVFSHANGFYKEVWETTLKTLLQQIEADGRSLPIEEVWALDCINQGDSAVLNRQVLGDVFNWADHGRDLLSFVISFIDSPTLSSPPSQGPTLLSPAKDVAPERFSLDHASPTASGPSIPSPRTYRDRLIVGIGHSLGGAATAFASSALPSLFSSIILIDPVLPTPHVSTRSMEKLTTGALVRKERWSSREEALESFGKKPFFQAWDRRALEAYCEFGLEEVEGGGVKLKCEARDEALTFCDPMSVASRRACSRLSLLPRSLPVHFIFADSNRSVLPEENIDYILGTAVPHASASRVKGAGHLVVHEKPEETARLIGEFVERTYPREDGKRKAKL